MFNIACELFEPMGKTGFSSIAKIKTSSVSKIGKQSQQPMKHRPREIKSATCPFKILRRTFVKGFEIVGIMV